MGGQGQTGYGPRMSDSASTTDLVALLTRLIAIRTDPNDGRSHSISLTAKGRATHDKVIVAALERERRLLSVLKKDEREVLIDLLRRVHGNLDAVKGVGGP